MRPEEIQALGELAGDALAGIATHARDMHERIAQRVFAAVGPAATPVRVVHDQIAHGAYAATRGSLGALTRAAARAASATRAADAPSIHQAPPGRLAVGALNGAFGDMLRRRQSTLAVPMTLRLAGHDVAIDRDSLAVAFPHATPRLAMFVHGLCETDDAWTLREARSVPYGHRLQAELGYTPLYIRYNSGLHISENGRELAHLLGQVIAAWPVEVHEIALIGHSMGGLVARSACHYGAGSEWTAKVRHLFTLGAPHRGVPLEQVAHAVSAALALVPETRGFARTLNLRSSGIKDLRHGYLVDEDWLGRDCDAFLRRTASEIPFTPSANHYFISATLSRRPDAAIGRIIGDLLVLRASAWAHGGHGERMRFPVEHYRHLGGANHFELLNHPAIYDQIRGWLSSRGALPTP